MNEIATIGSAQVDHQRATLEDVARLVAYAESLDEATEVRARVEAAKAWAKVHGKIRDLRLSLLTAEVAALVRVVELGGGDLLPSRERRAGEWLAGQTVEERSRILAESGTATTAVGMCQSIWRETEIRDRAREMRSAGIAFASEPSPTAYSESAIRLAASQKASDFAGALSRALSDYGQVGEFSIEEMAADVMSEASIRPDLVDDPEFVQGVREVCREVVRKAPALSFGDTIVPRFITCMTPAGTWVRIPSPNASVAQLDEMIALREAQIEQDRVALARLVEFANRVKATPGVTDTTRLGSVLVTSDATDAAPAEGRRAA